MILFSSPAIKSVWLDAKEKAMTLFKLRNVSHGSLNVPKVYILTFKMAQVEISRGIQSRAEHLQVFYAKANIES